MVSSFHLWSRKEQGFLQARQSSREMKRAAWQHKGQDCEVQSNLTHMECFRRGQKGDLLKDKIKLEKGERRGKGRMVPVKSRILGDSEYLQNQRHCTKQTRETEQQREERSVTKIFMWATHTVHFWFFWCTKYAVMSTSERHWCSTVTQSSVESYIFLKHRRNCRWDGIIPLSAAQFSSCVCLFLID